MNTASSETDASPIAAASMRAAATWFLAQTVLPSHQTVKLFAQDFTTFLDHLIPQTEQLAAGRAGDDAQAMVARAGLAEARRRLGIAERPGLNGEVERVKRLARSVLALRDHYDTLTGVRMCVACDQAIEDGEEAVPYERASATGGTGWAHGHCANSMSRSPH
ncbi:DUF6415 family natural product biosynthesis protein [Streptomyces sp. NPDC051677]|uniref:DUF6415 family natural product biosynthesis protein n=1 Tax=Streptomyces sp. NPDC051677 TaxID=3365669 RepID=UPI0037D201C7